jgi:hypothetical protein
MVRTATIDIDDSRIEWDGWVPTLIIEEYGNNGIVVKRHRITFSDPGTVACLRKTLQSLADVMRKEADAI